MPDLRDFGIDGSFDVEKEAQDDFSAIPAGKYRAIIADSEQRTTKAGTGSYLKLKLQVVDGPYENRIVWANLNLDNPSADAVRIARQDLAQICQAVGLSDVPENTEALHDVPLGIIVAVRQYNGQDQNEVKGYASLRPKTTPKAPPSRPPAPTEDTAEKKALKDFGLGDDNPDDGGDPPF